MILYVLIGLTLASFVIAFLSAKTWHWGYVILVEAIFLATFGFFLLAAETLRINGALRKDIKTQEKQLADVNAENEAIKEGSNDTGIIGRIRNSTDPPMKIAEDADSIPSLETLNHELLLATRLRGRVWRYVTPAGPIDPKTGSIRVTFGSPPPRVAAPANGDTPEAGPPAPAAAPPAPAAPGLKAETVVYLFEDESANPAANAPQKPLQFLGEFNVTQAAGQQATLQFVQPLGPKDLEVTRLAASRGPWVMYETMPMDRYEIFAGLKEDQLKQLLPKQSVEEYLKNGKEATADDDPWRKVGVDADGKLLPPDQIDKAVKKIYQRRLRDYAVELDELARRRVTMLAEIEALNKDIAQLDTAQDIAKKLQAYRTDERQKLTNDLAGIRKEREAIEKHLANVQQLLAKARQLTDETMAKNRQLAAELAARQLHSRPAGNGASPPAKRTEPLAVGQ